VAPLGRQHDTGRRLVCRGDHDDAGATRVQCRNIYAELVDRHMHGVQAHRARGPYGLTGLGVSVAGILEGGAPDAEPGQRPQYQVESLREPGAHDDPLLIGGRRAHAPQVPRDHLAQHGAAARVPVVEVRGSHAAACLPCRPHPVASREARQIGHA